MLASTKPEPAPPVAAGEANSGHTDRKAQKPIYVDAVDNAAAAQRTCGAYGYDVEHVYRRLMPLRPREAQHLLALGTSLDALLKPEVPARQHVVFHADRPLFDFPGERGVEGDGSPAIMFLARDESGRPIDLVAWEPSTGKLAAWLDRAALLGEDQLWAPRIANAGALNVFESPRDWLREDRRGVVIINAKRAARQLRFAGKLCAESIDLGLRLDGMFKADRPEIVVPKCVLEAAE